MMVQSVDSCWRCSRSGYVSVDRERRRSLPPSWKYESIVVRNVVAVRHRWRRHHRARNRKRTWSEMTGSDRNRKKRPIKRLRVYGLIDYEAAYEGGDDGDHYEGGDESSGKVVGETGYDGDDEGGDEGGGGGGEEGREEQNEVEEENRVPFLLRGGTCFTLYCFICFVIYFLMASQFDLGLDPKGEGGGDGGNEGGEKGGGDGGEEGGGGGGDEGGNEVELHEPNEVNPPVEIEQPAIPPQNVQNGSGAEDQLLNLQNGQNVNQQDEHNVHPQNVIEQPAIPPQNGNQEDEQNRVPFLLRGGIYFTLYCLICFVIYFLMAAQFDLGLDPKGEGGTNSTGQAVPFSQKAVSMAYFHVVSMYTIGFGDIVAKTGLAKVVVCCLNFISITLIALLVTDMVDYVIEKLEGLMFAGLTEFRRTLYRTLLASSIVFSGILVGYIGTKFVYGDIGHGDSFYLVLMSLSSIGYGDKSYTTDRGRCFAICWLGAFMPVFERALKHLARTLMISLRPYEVKFWNYIHGFFYAAQQQQNPNDV